MKKLNRWAKFEFWMLTDYNIYWVQRTKATWLLWFNTALCTFLIGWYHSRLPYRPPTFNPFYVRICHRYMRWRSK